jgi:hypothetical protein
VFPDATITAAAGSIGPSRRITKVIVVPKKTIGIIRRTLRAK